MAAVGAVRGAGLQAYADVVFNHRNGGDFTEDVWAQEVDWNDRNRTDGPWHLIKAWTGFDFPGRGDQYSSYKWHWWHFDAVSYDHNHPDLRNRKLFRLKDKQFRAFSHIELITAPRRPGPTDEQLDRAARSLGRWLPPREHARSRPLLVPPAVRDRLLAYVRRTCDPDELASAFNVLLGG